MVTAVRRPEDPIAPIGRVGHHRPGSAAAPTARVLPGPVVPDVLAARSRVLGDARHAVELAGRRRLVPRGAAVRGLPHAGGDAPGQDHALVGHVDRQGLGAATDVGGAARDPARRDGHTTRGLGLGVSSRREVAPPHSDVGRNDSRPGIPQAHPLVLHPSRGVLVGAVGRPRPGGSCRWAVQAARATATESRLGGEVVRPTAGRLAPRALKPPREGEGDEAGRVAASSTLSVSVAALPPSIPSLVSRPQVVAAMRRQVSARRLSHLPAHGKAEMPTGTMTIPAWIAVLAWGRSRSSVVPGQGACTRPGADQGMVTARCVGRPGGRRGV